MAAFAGESQARNRYTYFASQARKEGFEQIAAIFEETANQEKEHAKREFKFLRGGNGGARLRLSKELVKNITTEEAIELVEKIIEFYKANASHHQRLGAMIEKMEFEQFKTAVIGE